MYSQEYLELYKEKSENLQKFIKQHIMDYIEKEQIDEFILGALPSDELREKAKEELKKNNNYSSLLEQDITHEFIEKNVMKVKILTLMLFGPAIKNNQLEEFIEKILDKVEYKNEDVDRDWIVNKISKYIQFFSEI